MLVYKQSFPMKLPNPILALLIIVSLSISSSCSAELSDIEWHWAKTMIQSAVSKGIINGYSDGTFRPENSVSFIEACAIAFRTSWAVEKTREASYLDWRTPYIEYYKAKDFDGVRNPEVNGSDDRITREKALYILLRSKWIVFDTNFEWDFANKSTDTGFSDFDAHAPYALYIKYAKDNGIVSGYDGLNFGYKKNVTRAEFVKMALGIFERNDLKNPTDYIDGLNLINSDTGKVYDSVANSVTINGITYWKNASRDQVNANKSANNQSISSFIKPDGTLTFKDVKGSILPTRNAIMAKYTNLTKMIQSPNIDKTVFNYSSPKYYSPNLSIGWMNQSFQIQINLFWIWTYVWSKFEFEKLLESGRQRANETNTWKQILEKRPLNYAEIIFLNNSSLWKDNDYIYFSLLEAYYQLLPDYSILY